MYGKISSVHMFVLTQTVCIPALQTPPSGQADLWELVPGKPGSIAVPVSWLVAPKPCEQVARLCILILL